MSNRKDVLFHMKAHPYWDEYEKDLLQHRPIIPEYDPNNDNSEKWKYESARQSGFDIALSLLKIEVK